MDKPLVVLYLFFNIEWIEVFMIELVLIIIFKKYREFRQMFSLSNPSIKVLRPRPPPPHGYLVIRDNG